MVMVTYSAGDKPDICEEQWQKECIKNTTVG